MMQLSRRLTVLAVTVAAWANAAEPECGELQKQLAAAPNRARALIVFADCLAAGEQSREKQTVALGEAAAIGAIPDRLVALNNLISLQIEMQAYAKAGQTADALELPLPRQGWDAGEYPKVDLEDRVRFRLSRARAAYFQAAHPEPGVARRNEVWNKVLIRYHEALNDGWRGDILNELQKVTLDSRAGLETDQWLAHTDALSQALASGPGLSEAVKFLHELECKIPIASADGIELHESLEASIVACFNLRRPSPAEFGEISLPKDYSSTSVLSDIVVAFQGKVIWQGLKGTSPSWEEGKDLAGLFPAIALRRVLLGDDAPGIPDIQRIIFRDAKRPVKRDRRWMSRTVEGFAALLNRTGRDYLVQRGKSVDENARQAFGRFAAAWFLDHNSDSASLAAALISRDGGAIDPGLGFRKQLVKFNPPVTIWGGVQGVLLFHKDPWKEAPSSEDALNLRRAFEYLNEPKRASSYQNQAVRLDQRLRLEKAPEGKVSIYAPHEGEMIVQGPRQASATAIEVRVYSPCARGDQGFLKQRSTNFLTGEDGKKNFDVRLPNRLVAGDRLEGSVTQTGGQVVPIQTTLVGPEPAALNRLRLYTKLGMEIFPPGVRSFSGHRVNIHTGLTADYVWHPFQAPPPGCSAALNRQLIEFHGFLETRLDSISNTIQDEALAKMSVTRAGRLNTIGAAPRLGPAIEAGAWAPFLLRKFSWRYRGSDIGLFVAPLSKMGLHGRFEKNPQIPVDQPGPYWYYATGVRTGYLRYFPSVPGSKKTGPELLTHVDFVIGRWKNFWLPGLDGNPASTPIRYETRVHFSLPSFPAYFGFFWNAGPGPNDYRFFVGHRYDLRKLKGNWDRYHEYRRAK